jgi:hypothetical protein
MFANGSEYDSFLEENCYKCKKFVYYDESTEENPVCEIEEAISLSTMFDKKSFIKDHLQENSKMSRYDCNKMKQIALL